MKIGYALSSEEFGPNELVELGQSAEEYGFDFLMISDHYHPWLPKGQSPFVWNVIGALSQVIKNIEIGTGVTALNLRYNPALIAQAAMTAQVQLDGRFILGVGTGENLNEHIVGLGWPTIGIRRQMLTEAVKIIRLLWQGGYQTFHGKFYNIEDAQIYTLYEKAPPIIVSAFGENSAKLAGGIGDGFVTTKPKEELTRAFAENGGQGKAIYGEMSVVYAESEEEAKELALKSWPLIGLPEPLNTELRKPIYFKKVGELLSKEDLLKNIPFGNNQEKIIQSINKYKDSGFNHVYIHNVGPNQKNFIKWISKNVLDNFRS